MNVEGTVKKCVLLIYEDIRFHNFLFSFSVFFKLQNVLIDVEGNIKVSNFGLNALPQHFGIIQTEKVSETDTGDPVTWHNQRMRKKGFLLRRCWHVCCLLEGRC